MRKRSYLVPPGIRVGIRQSLIWAESNGNYYSNEDDPAMLADYVIALLRHERDLSNSKDLCIKQLLEFLQEGWCSWFCFSLVSIC